MMIKPHSQLLDKGDGVRSIWLVSAIAVACVIAPAAQATSLDTLKRLFSQLDTNGDGQVSAIEFATKKVIVFSLFDANKDNMLQRDEVSDLDPQKFPTVDKDGDGQLSGLEFVESPVGRFQTYDADGNGFMTFDEFANEAGSPR
jgi:hypothetical protein